MTKCHNLRPNYKILTWYLLNFFLFVLMTLFFFLFQPSWPAALLSFHSCKSFLVVFFFFFPLSTLGWIKGLHQVQERQELFQSSYRFSNQVGQVVHTVVDIICLLNSMWAEPHLAHSANLQKTYLIYHVSVHQKITSNNFRNCHFEAPLVLNPRMYFFFLFGHFLNPD